ncbi:MAG: MFS transporter [Salibacteraceae bacterium]
MRDKLKAFIKQNFGLLGFGVLLSYFSGFGQTFLLSLYVPSIEALLSISNTQFGTIYATATIGSALTLPWLGGYFDKAPLKPYTIMVVFGLCASLLLLSFATNIVLVVIAFFGLRLFGQGLMSHISIASMARYFSKARGKAISISGIGHPAGEASLPLIITLLIAAFGWQSSLQVSAAICLLVVAPLALLLLQLSKSRINTYHQHAVSLAGNAKKINTLKFISERRFWIIAPVVFILGFTNTAIFFFQLKLGAERGWSAEWVALSVSAFAIAGAIGLIVSGPLVDRFSGKKLFPYYLLPYLAGVLLLMSFSHAIVYPVALALLGLGNGLGSTIKNAMLAELYGTEVIGRIRSLFTTIMVLSTALGPISFGILLDLNWNFSMIFGLTSTIILLVSVNALRKP